MITFLFYDCQSVPGFHINFIFPGGLKSLKSIEDLKTKFKEEYPTDQLISIPVVKLQDYRSVPVHLTEDDIRTNIKQEEEENLQERIPNIRAKKREILSVLSKLKFNAPSQRMIEEVTRNLNNLLFEEKYITLSVIKTHVFCEQNNDCC